MSEASAKIRNALRHAGENAMIEVCILSLSADDHMTDHES